MTFMVGTWAVDGNQEAGQLLRLMNQAATLSGNGVVGHLDCQVNANSPATAGIIITPGGVVVLGQEATAQGTYTTWNLGNDTTLSIASTGGTPRSDMIIARAEDPTFSGTPWGGNPAGQIIYPRVWSNCPAGATGLSGAPSVWSAVPLARIDMPANVSVVQQSYIHDLRQVANPQRQLGVLTAAGPGSPSAWTVGTTPVAWPPGANWQIQIPLWATGMVIAWWIADAYCNTATQPRGFINPIIGATVGSPLVSFPQTLVSVSNAIASGRVNIQGSTSQAIGPSLRGTTQTLQFAQVTDGTHSGLLSVDEGSQYSVLYQFQQNAATS